MEKFSVAKAKQIDLVEYLASLGQIPKEIRNQNYWYLSPLREEKTASFKVDRRLNLWYDHGTGKGGSLVEFGTQYFRCSVTELLELLSKYQPGQTSFFHQPNLSEIQHSAPAPVAGERNEDTTSKIVIVDSRPIAKESLLDYLQKRKVSLEIADRFCKEVDFLLYGKKHSVIGFKNNSGGYELRSENFKGSSSPKDISFLDNNTKQIAVFEGFFDFLSFQTINKNKQSPLTNCLVLNSLAFLEKSRPLMEKFERVHLILDRDNAGIKHTQQALQWDRDRYLDRSDFYIGSKDLNEWLVKHHQSQEQRQEQSQRTGRRL